MSYPKPGRGAWRQSGGLLPAKPGQQGTMGYYRLAVKGESFIGSDWADEIDESHDAEVVHYGVRALQGLVGAAVDGWYGTKTDAKVRAAQQRYRVEVDGIVGPASMKVFLTPLIEHIAAASSVPVYILGGLLMNESALDPAAVGVNGEDHGLAQINLAAHRESVTMQEALDPDYALRWSAQELSETHARWSGRTIANPWKIAIANHNSPLLAKRWATTGQAPVVAGRPFQIAEYVDTVMTLWS